MRYTFYIMGLALLVLTCCHKDPEPNKCAGKLPVSAAFKIEEALGFVPDLWIYYDTDTVLTGAATFTALDAKAKQYTWFIGSETITGKSFYRSGFPQNTRIPITLIIKKEPNNECFPTDDGIDTLTRTFYTGNIFTSQVWGTYRGAYSDAPKDSFNIKWEYQCCFGFDLDKSKVLLLGADFCDTIDFAQVANLYQPANRLLVAGGAGGTQKCGPIPKTVFYVEKDYNHCSLQVEYFKLNGFTEFYKTFTGHKLY